MSGSPSRGFLSNQKLEAVSRKISKGKSITDLQSFLLEKDREQSFGKEHSQSNTPIQKKKQQQKNFTSPNERGKKTSINISEGTQKRLLSELNRQNAGDAGYRYESRPESQSTMQSFTFEWRAVFQFLKLMFLSYEFNILDELSKIDSEITTKIQDLLKLAPGYKPIQYVFTFYTLKYNYAIGLVAALLYPLPYSFLFMIIPASFTLPFLVIFALAGMRCGTLALLLKYCLHFPKSPFHWIVFIFTVFIGIFLPNNFIFLALYAISIFLSFYLTEDSEIERNRASLEERKSNNSSVRAASIHAYQNQDKYLYKQYKVIDGLPETYPMVSLGIILLSMIGCWLWSRYTNQKYLEAIVQILPISLLASSKQMLAFFPSIYQQVVHTTKFSSGTFIAASFLFPGPHYKVFMFLFNYHFIGWTLFGYFSLYMPSILLTSIFIAYRYHFYTETYNNIRMSIQAVGNGLVLSLVVMILRNQECFFNMICIASIVILVVAKLYKLRQLFAITLGIFLISARTIILHVNKGISFTDQACIPEPNILQ